MKNTRALMRSNQLAQLAGLMLVLWLAAEPRDCAAQADNPATQPTPTNTPALPTAPPTVKDTSTTPSGATDSSKTQPDQVEDSSKGPTLLKPDAEQITVSVEEKALNEAKGSSGQKPYVLYLNGWPLKGLRWHSRKIQDEATKASLIEITFYLDFRASTNEENRNSWNKLLGKPRYEPIPLQVGVGFEGTSPVSSRETYVLEVMDKMAFKLWLGIEFVLLCLLIGFGYNSSMLRDAKPLRSNDWTPYSLARCQMAWWFFLVLSAFLLIWLVTWNLDTISESVLGLIGISAGTFLGAAVIESNKEPYQNDEEYIKFSNEQQQLEARLRELDSQIKSNPATETQRLSDLRTEEAGKKKRLDEVNILIRSRIDALNKGPESIRWNFFNDILSDANGISFHRFQLFVWTIVLGIIFVTSVWRTLTMPPFSPTLLGLMGIVSGTYLGFKFPEKQVGKDTDKKP